jgi:arylformamidase
MKIYDISRTLDENSLTYPGDAGINIKSFSKNEWNLSEINMGSHTGTHVDTKLHLEDGHPGVDEIPLDKCYGNSIVIDLTSIEKKVTRSDLKNRGISKGDIVLLKTPNSDFNMKEFREDFVYIDNDAAKFFVESEVMTLAFDYLSVGPRKSHEILLKNDILVFENVNLKNVKPGRYLFIGLPIKLKTEGAPARVILIEK